MDELHDPQRSIARRLADVVLEVGSMISFGPRGWHSERGKSERYRIRALGGMECEFGPMHHGYSDTPSGWWWRIRRNWTLVLDGYLSDRGCFMMRRTAKHVEAEVRRIQRKLASTIPLWEVGCDEDQRVREMSGLRLRFNPTFLPSSCDGLGWNWNWAILKDARFVESGVYRSSGHFDFAEVASFVEEKARGHLFKQSPFR